MPFKMGFVSVVLFIVAFSRVDIVNGAALEARAMQFIGVGYDIVNGNPDGGDSGLIGVDPGLLVDRRILDFTFQDSEMSGDGKRGLADQCEFLLRNGEPIQTRQTTFSGPASYRDKLLSHVTQTTGQLRGRLADVAFTGSTLFEDVQAKTSAFGTVLQTDETLNSLAQARYRTELAGSKNYSLGEGFVSDACRLPSTYDSALYFEFLEKWGTHVVMGLTLGFKQVNQYEATRSTFLEVVKNKVEPSFVCKHNASGVASDVEVDLQTFNSGLPAGVRFGELSLNYSVGNDNYPEPIHVELDEITDLFGEDFWGRFEEYVDAGLCGSQWITQREERRANLATAIDNYAIWRAGRTQNQYDEATFTTDTRYYFRYSLPPIPAEKSRDFSFRFRAKANNDVRIGLAPSDTSGRFDTYGIVIGGWRNTQSVIRRTAQGTNEVIHRHIPLNPAEFRVFRVSYVDGTIRVYAGDDPPVLFMEYTDPNPRAIGVVGFSTGWSSNGEFVFNTCDFQCQDPSSVEVSISWPVGTYALPKPVGGCPGLEFGWMEGTVYQDLEDAQPRSSQLSPGNHFAGNVISSNNILTSYCVKTTTRTAYEEWNWPKGSYCIAKYGDCPPGFGTGSVFWDDEDNNNDNVQTGVYPDGVYSTNTKVYFCCREDGPPTQEICLPNEEPFYLLKRFASCQQVSGTSVSEEFVVWDTENTGGNDDAAVERHPYLGIAGPSSIRLDYCYYEPRSPAV